jgi:hypothetical protein
MDGHHISLFISKLMFLSKIMKEEIMEKKHFLWVVIILLSVSCAAFADRELDRSEILQILQQLTSQPRKTWLSAGTIEATHTEYRASKVLSEIQINDAIATRLQEYVNDPDKREFTGDLQQMTIDAIPFNVRYELSNEYTMSSTVTVRYDGDRFYWEINVQSRTDSVEPGHELSGNFMAEYFNLDWNARRVFAWDGEKYSTYSASSNHAVVDSTGKMPHVVNGPLTAGIVPWGYGYYSYENLTAAESSAVEVITSGRTRIELTCNNTNGGEMTFVLDPEKDYAVTSCTMRGLANTIMTKQYSNFQMIESQYVPTTILVEKYDETQDRLIARDLWEITKIDGSTPEPESFDMEYTDDTLMELVYNDTDKPTICRYSDLVNKQSSFTEKSALGSNKNLQRSNCATLALKYSLSKLGFSVSDEQLSELVSGRDNQTNLAAMKQFVQNLGFYCTAITTNIQILSSLQDCHIILHIPDRNHFVVLDSINDKYVNITDLTKKESKCRIDINTFNTYWTQGTALLISKQAVSDEFAEIDDVTLNNIVGASGYSCTNLLQEYDVEYCIYIAGECDGYYKIYWERWGCKVAPSGSCSSSIMERYRKCPCIEDPYNPGSCQVNGDWTFYYMRACA